MKRLILIYLSLLLSGAAAAQSTGTFRIVDARDTFRLSGRSVAEIVYNITTSSKNNEVPTAAAVWNLFRGGVDTMWNLTALRAYTGSSTLTWINTVEGLFARVTNGSEDGGTLIVATNGIKWKRINWDGRTWYPEFWEIGGYDETGTAGGITDVSERIQAAINKCTGTGGQVVLRRRFTPYDVVRKASISNAQDGTHKACLELKSNMSFVIEEGCTLRKAASQQTNANGSLSVIYADSVSNLTITGGGTIDGNTANQPGWTGGYGQGGNGGCGIFIGAPAAAPNNINSNVSIADLNIINHFSTAIETRKINVTTINNVRFSGVGEGIEFENSTYLRVHNVYGNGAGGTQVGDGFETSQCDDVVATNLEFRDWSSGGTAFDIYGTRNAVISNFIITGVTLSCNGISVSSTAGGTITNDVIFSDGYIKNCATGAYWPDGYGKLQNIVFDSCAIGVQSGALQESQGYTRSYEVTDCTFKNRSTGIGVYISGRRPVVVRNCHFEAIQIGVSVIGSASNLIPNLHITGCTFSRLSLYPINFDAQGQSTFTPQAVISGNTFKDNGRPAIFLPTRSQDIVIQGSAIDTTLTLVGALTEITTDRIYIVDATSSTINTIVKSSEGHVVTLSAPNLSAGQSKTINNYLVSSGNVQLDGGDNYTFTRGGSLTLKYNASKQRWYEIARTHSGALSDSTYTVGENKIFADGWNVENVGAASQSAIVVYRFGSLNTQDQYFFMPRQSMIRTLGIRSNTAITTGTITGELWWNDGGPNGTVVLGSGNTSATTTYARFSKFPGSTNMRFHMKYTTSSDFNHPTADIQMWMEIEY